METETVNRANAAWLVASGMCFVLGIVAGAALANAIAHQYDPWFVREMKDRETINLGCNAGYEHIARWYSGQGQAAAIYKDAARFKRQRERIHRLLDLGGKGFGSEAWFDEQEAKQAKGAD